MSANLLVVGGSAGGVQAVERLVADLPADLDAAVLVTVHIPAHTASGLPQILSRAGRLPARHALGGTPLRPNEILVAPPDRHLTVMGDFVHLSAGPKVNRHRPSVDVMFTSAARWAGPGVVGVVVSGALDDGAVGAALIAKAGGRIFVQEPSDAQFRGMPKAALAAVPDAKAAPIGELGAMVTDTVRAGSAHPSPVAQEGVPMSDMAETGDVFYLAPNESRLTRLVCPDCGGSLAQADLPTVSWFRCHVGHQWSPQSLAAAQAETTENKLWAAVAAIEEEAALNRHLGTAAHSESHLKVAGRAAGLAELLRSHLEKSDARRQGS